LEINLIETARTTRTRGSMQITTSVNFHCKQNAMIKAEKKDATAETKIGI
jgi:hypothetical protein